MKSLKIFIVLFICFTGSSVFGQTYEDLYIYAGFEQEARGIIEKMIDALAAKDSEIPADRWDRAKNQLDFSNYKERMLSVLEQHYTLAEVKEIFLQNDMFEPVNETGRFIFKTKDSANEDMYRISKISSREMMQQVIIFLKRG